MIRYGLLNSDPGWRRGYGEQDYHRLWRAGRWLETRGIGVSNQILRYINTICYARQPKIRPFVNKTG